MLLKHELKINLKSLFTWLLSVGLIIFFVIALYPVAFTKMSGLDDMMKQFPTEFLKALNLESYDWDKVLNYYSYEFQYIMIASCVFASLMGASFISREETSKSIQFLFVKPISRTKIFFSKLATVFIYILMYNIVLYLITMFSIKIFVTNQTVDYILLAKIYLGLLLAQVTFSTIGIFLASVLKKSRVSTVLASSVVIFTYIIGMISKIADKVKDLIYISPVHYVLADEIARNNGLQIKYVLIMAIFVPIMITISWLFYRKRDYSI